MAQNNRPGRGVALPSLPVGSARSARAAAEATASSLAVTNGGRSGQGTKLPPAASSSITSGRPTASRAPRKTMVSSNSRQSSGVGAMSSIESNGAQQQQHTGRPPGPMRQKTLPLLTGSSMTTARTHHHHHHHHHHQQYAAHNSGMDGGAPGSLTGASSASSTGHNRATVHHAAAPTGGGGLLPSIVSPRHSSNPPPQPVTSQARSTRNSMTTAGGGFVLQPRHPAAVHDPNPGRITAGTNSKMPSLRQGIHSYDGDVVVGDAELTSGGGGISGDRQLALQGRFDSAGWSEIGAKQENQDVFDIQRLGNSAGELYVSVLDGHGPAGGDVAQHGTKVLHSLVASGAAAAHDELGLGSPLLLDSGGGGGGHGGSSAAARKQLLRLACLQTHQTLCEAAALSTANSGSTVTVAVLRRHQLTMAWLGDSRSVLGREDRKTGKLRAAQLTRDHNCDDMVEAARIRRCGGKVQQYYYCGRFVGPKRIWLKEPGQRTPGLMVSRSVGDEVAHSVGCIADPEMLEMDLTVRDKVLIVASDGVWDGISNQKAVDIAWACATAAEASRAVVDAALDGLHRHGLADNVTAAVVFLPGPGGLAKTATATRGQAAEK